MHHGASKAVFEDACSIWIYSQVLYLPLGCRKAHESSLSHRPHGRVRTCSSRSLTLACEAWKRPLCPHLADSLQTNTDRCHKDFRSHLQFQRIISPQADEKADKTPEKAQDLHDAQLKRGGTTKQRPPRKPSLSRR